MAEGLTPKYRLLLKYPTRGRPKQFEETRAMYIGMLDEPDLAEMLVTCDHDDHTMRPYRHNSGVHYGGNHTKIQAINADIGKAQRPWDIVLLVSDDMIPQVKGYDTCIREAMAKNYPDTDGDLWFFDGRQRAINTIQCMGRKRYDTIGHLYHPAYTSLWCDNEATDVGLRDGKLAFIDECIIKNESPDWGGNQKRDRLYLRNNSFYKSDRAIYERRKAQGFP
jgi:hypothetical protein